MSANETGRRRRPRWRSCEARSCRARGCGRSRGPTSQGIATLATIAAAARTNDRITPLRYGERNPSSLRKVAKTKHPIVARATILAPMRIEHATSAHADGDRRGLRRGRPHDACDVRSRGSSATVVGRRDRRARIPLPRFRRGRAARLRARLAAQGQAGLLDDLRGVGLRRPERTRGEASAVRSTTRCWPTSTPRRTCCSPSRASPSPTRPLSRSTSRAASRPSARSTTSGASSAAPGTSPGTSAGWHDRAAPAGRPLRDLHPPEDRPLGPRVDVLDVPAPQDRAGVCEVPAAAGHRLPGPRATSYLIVSSTR